MPQGRAKRPRRKAKQQRSRETVEAILEAAARVLTARGYGSATTNRIAEDAGVSIGTLYEYFANREEVFDALIRRELDAVLTALSGRSPEPDAPVDERLAQLVGAAMSAVRYGPELIRALEQVPEASFRRQLAVARRTVIDFVRTLLEQHRDELRVTDLDRAAFVVVSAAEGIGANATASDFDEALGREVTTLLKLYLTGHA
jgi:AcrR family transcriptional regulator